MSAPEPSSLLQTKLHPPRVAHGPILRTHLFELLDAGHNDALTLVSAPPGYGKSVLVSTWLAERKASFGWLSLDDSDNTPEVFLQYFIAAIRKQHRDACCDIASSFINSQPPNFSYLSNYLTEEIAAREKSTLIILDDFHYIRNKEIHDFIAGLIRNQAPNLRLVIITRRDPPLPLNTLRSQGILTEIRVQDLRFQPKEAADFLAPFAGEPLTEEALQNLDERLEGWAAGFRLVSLNLRYSKDVNRFLSELKGSPQVVREYLMNEVLAHQAPSFRKHLLKVAVLDRICAPLCEYLCNSSNQDLPEHCQLGQDDAKFSLMSKLLKSNLFMMALDDEGIWYRFHHFFQDFLLEQLKNESGEEQIAILHTKAAKWYAEQGLIEEAVFHALKGSDPSDAAKIVIANRQSLFQTEQDERLTHLINLLPAEQTSSEPELLLQQAWSLLELLELGSDNVLEQAESLIEKMPPDTPGVDRLKGEAHALRCVQYCEATNSAKANWHGERALQLLDDDQLVARGLAMIMLVYSLQMEGRMNEGKAQLFEAFGDKYIQNTAFHTRLLGVLCFMHWVEADLDATMPVVTELNHLGQKLGFAHAIAHSLYLKGIIHYERNEVDEAEDSLTEVLETYQDANIQNSAHATFALALTYEAQNRPHEARQLSAQVIRQALELHNAPLLQTAEAFQAELNLRQGNLADASRWAKNYRCDPHRSSARFFVPQLTFVKVLIAEDNSKSQQRASQLLKLLEEIHTKIHNKRVLIQVLVLKALYLQKSKDPDAAVDALHQAIHLAQPGKFIRLFIDAGPDLIPLLNSLELDTEGIQYVGRILSGCADSRKSVSNKAFPETESPSSDMHPGILIDDPLVDPLTERELEVLTLLAQRLSNKEIAERLSIALGTVKRHTNTLYRKLNVHGRRNAVAKAQGLGLLRS